MAFNGSGTFVRLYNWVNDAAANIKIRADRMDAEMNGMATGLSTCITKDGQTTVTANLPMATYRHTGVGAAVNRTDYARAAEVQDGSFNWVDGGGTADAITAAYGIPLTALVDGQLCFVRATAANATTTPTFSPSGLTARTIVKSGNQALAVGDIAGDGHELILRYRLSDTKWELLNPAVTGVPTLTGNNTLSGNNTFTGKVLTPDDGELTIASGAITVTGVYHTVDTEGDAASDYLDTINGGDDGQYLVLQIENSARDVIITNAGNIVTPLGATVTLTNTSEAMTLMYSGALSKWFVQADGASNPVIVGQPSKKLYGMTLSNNGDDATNDIDIAAGAWVSDDGTTIMTLASSITKRLDAAWAAGTNQGGLDTGSIADTTYHLWAIHRPDTGVTDILFSASVSAPTMPANYTKKAAIGSIRRISGSIKAFTQYGNYFEWTSPVVDVDAQNPGTSAVTRTLTVPTGVVVQASIFAGLYGATTNALMGYISSLAQDNLAVQAVGTAALTGMANFRGPTAGARWSFTPVDVWTNTSAQVRSRLDASGASDRIGIITQGWMDPRI